MRKSSKSEIEGLTLAITRLSSAGKSAKDIQNYLECELLVSELSGTSGWATTRGGSSSK